MSGGNTILPWFAYDSQVGHLYLSEREENRKQKTKKSITMTKITRIMVKERGCHVNKKKVQSWPKAKTKT